MESKRTSHILIIEHVYFLMTGSVLRAAADAEAEKIVAEGPPQAAGPDSFLSFEEAGLVEFATNLDMHERFLARLTVSCPAASL